MRIRRFLAVCALVLTLGAHLPDTFGLEWDPTGGFRPVHTGMPRAY